MQGLCSLKIKTDINPGLTIAEIKDNGSVLLVTSIYKKMYEMAYIEEGYNHSQAGHPSGFFFKEPG